MLVVGGAATAGGPFIGFCIVFLLGFKHTELCGEVLFQAEGKFASCHTH
jgi:hypothetical protein